jgi:hypothetical protein
MRPQSAVIPSHVPVALAIALGVPRNRARGSPFAIFVPVFYELSFGVFLQILFARDGPSLRTRYRTYL